jgi:hypothetical protein
VAGAVAPHLATLVALHLSGLSLLGETIYAADTVQGRLVRLAVPR